MTQIKALERAKKRFAIHTPINEELGFNHGPKVIERGVKKFVKEIILEIDPDADIFMPVLTGRGAVDLDFIVGIKGFYLSIETKAGGKKPTPRQLETIKKKVRAGCVVLIIDESNLEDIVLVGELLLADQHNLALQVAQDRRRIYMML